ncbi:hypothetical protein Tsubulata_019275 [Turnera subulata]|uniref:Uncharacterized protein n=1 Tax=Turnera subulata TaxID=218843 RepID=A0A9Q0FP15_9ROSI|nr:hypothetical protein Tsubulata_019275 [Turnera subulata]
MDSSCSRSSSSEQQVSERQASQGSHDSDRQIFTEFEALLEKFTPVLLEVKGNGKLMDRPQVRKVVESFEDELRRARDLIRSSPSESPTKRVEVISQNLGRSLGLVLFASIDLSRELKQKIAALHKELMNVKQDCSVTSPNPSPIPSPCVPSVPSVSSVPSPGPSGESGFVSEVESENEIVEERFVLSVDNVALQLKYGGDEEFRLALSGLRDFIRDQVVDREWINDESIVPILFNRLGSSKPHNRSTIIQILRILATDNEQNKEKMAEVGYLSLLVKSLTREEDEQREAVGLLSELSHNSAVRRRIGRIQGCIVMLVTLLNGDDPTASQDAGRLLNALSSNTQNVLHMAEAGYFKPLVHCLREGSDMSKILMATALSRIELTDQCRGSLGDHGAVEPLVTMFKTGKLEAKLSALNALQNLSGLAENIKRLISSGIVVPLLQLLFSVTSVLMTLREPASAILAKIAQSESVLVNQDVAQQMLSLLNLSSPVIQYHLLEALNSIASHSSAAKVRRKMMENGAVQLLLPFLTEYRIKAREAALNLVHTLSKGFPQELVDQLGESNINNIINIFSSSPSKTEKATAIGILSNLPTSDKKSTEILKKSNLLPTLISMMSSSEAISSPSTTSLAESIAGVFIRFTVASDKKLQLLSAELGVIPLLVKFLSSESSIAKCRAATCLAQLSQNSLALRKPGKSRWACMRPSSDTFCQVHDGYCVVRSSFCLVKAGAIPPLIRILEGNDREADEAVVSALSTLVEDEIWESGSNYIAKGGGIEAIIRVMELGNVKAQEKALWMLERFFRIEEYRTQHGESAQVVLIYLAQHGDPRLKPATAQVLAQLELLQLQSSYF